MNQFRIIIAKPTEELISLHSFNHPYIYIGFFDKKGEVYYRTDTTMDFEISREDLIKIVEMNLNNLISDGLIEVNITKKGMELIERDKEANEE